MKEYLKKQWKIILLVPLALFLNIVRMIQSNEIKALEKDLLYYKDEKVKFDRYFEETEVMIRGLNDELAECREESIDNRNTKK